MFVVPSTAWFYNTEVNDLGYNGGVGGVTGFFASLRMTDWAEGRFGGFYTKIAKIAKGGGFAL